MKMANKTDKRLLELFWDLAEQQKDSSRSDAVSKMIKILMSKQLQVSTVKIER